MTTEIEIAARMINEGDEFVYLETTYWTAMKNAEMVGGAVHLVVQFADGGSGERIWDDPNTLVPVMRTVKS